MICQKSGRRFSDPEANILSETIMAMLLVRAGRLGKLTVLATWYIA